MTTKQKGKLAEVSVTIDKPLADVWQALVEPDQIKQYMFGTHVITDWKVGSPIVWKGACEGKPYEDKGEILKLKKGEVLQYSHFSPMSGEADKPENYHTITIKLAEKGQKTEVTLTQDNNETDEDRQHSEENWQMMLDSMKKFLENGAH
jgi:uncharacterized protein YndB with AHSA1/START domain